MAVWSVAGCAGCVVGGRTNLAAADGIDVVVEALAESLTEYHDERSAEDAAGRRRAVDALIDRMSADADNKERVDAHRAAFIEALERLVADERVEWQRYATSLDHLAILTEIGDGLRRMARVSASLDDEFRRHLIPLLGRAGRGLIGESKPKGVTR
jgi:hypothetical protein